MYSKPELIQMLRDFCAESMCDAPVPSRALLERIAAYEAADFLGGPTCSSMISTMGDLQKALGLRKLPQSMTETAWSFVTF